MVMDAERRRSPAPAESAKKRPNGTVLEVESRAVTFWRGSALHAIIKILSFEPVVSSTRATRSAHNMVRRRAGVK